MRARSVLSLSLGSQFTVAAQAAATMSMRTGNTPLGPIVDVTYDDRVSEAELHKLVEVLPNVIGEGVGCVEEPWTGSLGKGDLQVRFHKKGPLDSFDLNCVIEIRTKLVPSRVADKQRRSDLIRDRLASQVKLGEVGVWIVLADGAWSQT